MHEYEVVAKNLIGEYGWMFIGAFAVMMFKDAVVNLYQGLAIFVGNDFNNDDVIYISGRQARIVRVGFRKTIFYMTDRNTKMIVPNERLKILTLEKRLPQNGGKEYLKSGTDK